MQSTPCYSIVTNLLCPGVSCEIPYLLQYYHKYDKYDSLFSAFFIRIQLNQSQGSAIQKNPFAR